MIAPGWARLRAERNALICIPGFAPHWGSPGSASSTMRRLRRRRVQSLLRKCYCLSFRKKCKSNKRKWQEAKDQGIPWLQKRWSSLTILQEDYNDAVATALDDAVSDSAAPDLQPAPCADPHAALSSTSHRDSPSLRPLGRHRRHQRRRRNGRSPMPRSHRRR